ncbi:MAG: response regulator [Anaerolineae bacterium]|nr:response regulator [Anaerolineae bacterium]
MTQPRILIVEDDGDLAELLEAHFSTEKYDVLTAAWGAEALEIAQAEPLNLVVLDIRLPDINGYEVCRQLRLNRRTQDVPIVFLTEKRDRVDKLHGLELGVVDYITKPFDVRELRLRVRNALARANQRAFIHHTTELPEGVLVDERMTRALHGGSPWSIVVFSLRGLEDFRERYGFVAGDDVLRAVALMLRNAVRELGGEDDFIGHLDHDTFVVVTQPEHAEAIRERVQTKMHYSREFFYPVSDREAGTPIAFDDMLRLDTAMVGDGQGYADTNGLRAGLAEALARANDDSALDDEDVS